MARQGRASQQPVACQLRQAAIDFNRDNVPSRVGQSFGESTGAGAHFQHNVCGSDTGRSFQQLQQI